MGWSSNETIGGGSLVRRAVLVAGIAGGLAVPLYFFLMATVTPLAWDFMAYLEGAGAYMAGENFVGATPEVGNGIYVYPPIVVLLFAPYVLLGGWFVGFLIQSLVNVGLALLAAWLTIRTIESRVGRLSRIDRGLIGAFWLTSTYAMVALGQGQIDHLVALPLILGFLWIESGEQQWAGFAFAGAAVVKLFPAAIGVWLLYRRAWRAVATAVGVGIGAIATSFLLFGVETHVRYIEFILTRRSRVSRFEDGQIAADFMGLTLNRPLSVLLPDLDPSFYTPLAALLFLPVLWFVYRRTETFEDRLIAYLVTLIAIVLVSPASNVNHVLYLYFPLLTIVYALGPGPSRGLVLAGMLVMSFPLHIPHVARLAELAGLSQGAQGLLLGVVEPVLTAGTVTLYGLLIVVLGCLLHSARDRGDVVPDLLREPAD